MAGTPASSRSAYTGSYPIVNADVAAAAAIAVSKLAPGTAGQVLGGTGPSYALPPGYEFDYVQSTADLTVSATTSATANTAITGTAVTYDGATVVMVEFYSPAVLPGTTLGDRVTVCLFDNGASIGNLGLVQNETIGQSLIMPVHVVRRLTPSAIAHTYSIRAYRDGTNNGTIFMGAGGVDTRVPGFLRIVKV